MKNYFTTALIGMAITSWIGINGCDDDNERIEKQLPNEIEGKYVVEFNLNYEESDEVDTVLVNKGCVIQMADKLLPIRNGYRFAGWYTSQECKPEEEWHFGYKNGGYYPSVVLDSMAVNQSIRLYARWVSPQLISNAEQLYNMREDLYGWYVLDADIDLNEVGDWHPVGLYESDYEMADGEWWTKAFKGILDGKGHTISNLNLTTNDTGMKALFGAVANGEIRNLTLRNCHIQLDAPSGYVAPLVSVMKQDEGKAAVIENCNVEGLRVDVTFRIEQSLFAAVTGLVGGVWNGSISRCNVDGELNLALTGSGGSGELYVGGILGEGYSNTEDCSADMDIQVDISSDTPLKVFAGALQASASNVANCISTGNVVVDGCPTIAELYVGGLVGSERYGDIKNCAAQGDIRVTNCPIAQIGGILGEFSSTYGSIGTAFGIAQTSLKNCYASGNIYIENVDKQTIGHISGSGQPDALAGWFGPGMGYSVNNCSYLEQPIGTAADMSLTTLTAYNSIDMMKGTSMKDVLEVDEGIGQWVFAADELPVPVRK